MQWKTIDHWPARIASFGIALLLGASTGYWVLHWPSDATASAAVRAAESELQLPDSAAIAKLLGSESQDGSQTAPVNGAEAARFHLLGVLARSGGGGSAIIAVDGKPPKSFAVGSVVEPGLVLQSVAKREARLAADMHASVTQTLEIPAPVH
jgi:general secretion pathway protein C